MKKLLLLVFCLLFSLINIYSQGIPETINYQGILKDASGNIVPNGSYDILFSLYDVESGGSPLWTETQTLNISDGILNAQLGTSTPFPSETFNKAIWLGVKIGAGTELTPRIVLTSVPYSFYAMNVEDGKVVKSLNGLTDDVNLVAGSNVTITPSGNNITISATGGGSGIGGSGSTNYIPIFTSSTAIGNSNLSQDVAGMRLTNDLSNNINPTFSLTRTGTNSATSLSFTNAAGSTMSLGLRTDEKFGISTINKNVGMDDAFVIDYSTNSVGIGTPYPESKLSVNGTVTISGDNSSELNRTQTGSANLAPIAYANVNSDGTLNINATTSNVTLNSHSVGTGLYYFDIASESIYYTDYICIATLRGNVGGEITWSSSGGTLYIGTRNSDGTGADKNFTFVLYKK